MMYIMVSSILIDYEKCVLFSECLQNINKGHILPVACYTKYNINNKGRFNLLPEVVVLRIVHSDPPSSLPVSFAPCKTG